IEIVEAGTLELREMLMDQSIHTAILVEPAELQPEDFEVYQLMRTEIVAFMDPNHPLSKKRLLKWSDLNDYPFATYNEKDKVYHLVNKKLETKKAKDNLLFTSASWDYMIESVVDNRHMAILSTIYFI